VDEKIRKYELLPYSQLVWEMEQQMPGVYDTPFCLRFDTRQVDVLRLQQAIEQTIANHPVFEQLGQKYYDLHIHEDGMIGYLEGRINRILGDTQSLIIFAEDVGLAYQGKTLEKDEYLNYLLQYTANQSTQRYFKHKSQLIEQYGTVHCPVRPTIDYPLHATQEWRLGVHSMPISMVISSRLSMTQTVCLATTIAIMDYCQTDEAALTWAYLGRDTIQEQHIFGSLHKDIPMRIQRAESVDAYIRQLRQVSRQGIACSDYPLTLTPPYNETWNYAVNVLQQPNLLQALLHLPFAVEPILPQQDTPQMAYALLDIEIEKNQLVFRYSASHYLPESIARFAAMVQHNITWLTA